MKKIKINSQREKSLRALAVLMNKQQPSPIPVTRPLLECFDAVITPEENAFLLQMGTEIHTYEQAAALAQMPEELFRPFFERQLKKGLIWPEFNEDDVERYSLAGILVGWFEIFLSDGAETPEKQEFALRVDRLFDSWRKMNVFPIRPILNYKLKRASKSLRRIVGPKRTKSAGETIHIEVNRQVKIPDMKVVPTRDVYELINMYGERNQIALIHCFCRQWHKMVNEPCRFDLPAEACIALGKVTKYAVNYGIGRYIDRETALEIIEEVQKKGAVHQVFHEKEDIDGPEFAICNCCWDCCGVLGSYNRGAMPLRFKSYYISQISEESRCTGCGRCEKYCPVGVLSVLDKKVHLQPEKCIGCGQCELQCPEDVFSLLLKEREVILPLQKKSKARIPS